MPYLNIKGCELELAQRNSQASVPFVVSNIGYGFLWNNPAIGRVVFGKMEQNGLQRVQSRQIIGLPQVIRRLRLKNLMPMLPEKCQ